MFFVLQLAAQRENAPIHEITFQGLTKTNPTYLKAIMLTKEGKAFSEDTLEFDIQNIKNMNLFFAVEHEKLWLQEHEAWKVIITIEEAHYLYPVLSASGFEDQLQVEVGFNQINFLGKAQSIGLVYKYYDRHSVSAFYSAERHKNNKTGHFIGLTKYSTVEPLYFEDTVSSFNFDNYNASVGGHYWFNYDWRVGLGGMYMYELYRQLDTGSFDLGQSEFRFHKYQIRSFVEYNIVDQYFELLNGFGEMFYLETVQTVDYPEISFFKLTNELLWYKRFGNRHNIALRNNIGIATNNESPFAPFVLDGFINVRGVGNRVARGTAEFIFNAEYRFSFWRHKWFFLQAVAFGDFGALREPGDKIVNMFERDHTELFLGGGLRLHSRFFYNMIFRIDYSVSPVNPSNHGLTFGFGQFF